MHCRRCRTKMVEERGTHHKKKKWRCPKCGAARMENVTHKRRQKGRRERRGGRHQHDE